MSQSSKNTPKIRNKSQVVPSAAATFSSASRKTKTASSSSDRKITSETQSSNNDNVIYRVNFEIRGKVQGVHFRKYTQMKATSFGLRGWCQNTNYSTVIGCMEGPRIKTEQMKQWLKSTGSPKSIITGAEFKETQSEQYTLTPGFQIIK